MPRLGALFLLVAIFSAAVCAIVYQLLIGSVSSYFLGNSVEQFSLTIGFFLAAMGLGSWLSRFVADDSLLTRLAQLEIWLGLLGGVSVGVLYVLYGYTDHFRAGMLALSTAIGALIGLEVPLITRLLRGHGTLRSACRMFCPSIIWGPCWPRCSSRTSCCPFSAACIRRLVAGLVNAGLGLGVVLAFKGTLLAQRAFHSLGAQALVVIAALGALAWQGEGLRERWESDLYEDRIVYSEQSAYQQIVLTQRDEHLRLYLNGHLQFASIDEHRYHEALVHPAMALTPFRERVLIIGGGDGLTAREVLKYEEVQHVDLVDLDPAVTRLAQRNIHLTRLNDNALNRRQVRVVNEDGFVFLQREHVPYNAILIDLPDPREESLAKLYSVEAYRLCRKVLGPQGVLATQASSPYHARAAYWSIAAALEEAGFAVHSYHLHVPSFGEWGFHLAGPAGLDPTAVAFSVPTRYLDRQVWGALAVFDGDMARLPVQANRLDRPVLARYYRQGWGTQF